MKRIKFIIACIFVLAPVILFVRNRKLNEQVKVLSNNQNTLLDSVSHYKIVDSLNVAKVKELTLTVDEYKRYRAEDAILIKKLKADKPKEVIKTITETRTEIVTLFDTVYVDSVKRFKYDDKWIKVDGLVYSDSVKLNIKNYEELLIVESLQKKKFWFIKLPVKLFGYKHKQINVISKNPNTQILSTEFITIKM